jgi:cation diffusion facilitator family transporter
MTERLRHYSQVQKVLWLVLGLNWAVAIAKMVYGFVSDSSSVTADGFHSLADGTSNIIGIIGVRFCSKPVDKDHPYGHRKYETLFALGIAAMLLMVAFSLAKAGVSRIAHPITPQIGIPGFIVMIATLAVNTVVMLYEHRRGKELMSDILVVDSMHTRADIFTSISVIIALIGVKLGFPILDPVITLVISLFITWSAFEIIRQESRILCDAVAIDNPAVIEKIALGVKGVKGCHKIRSRGRLDDIHIDLHVQVSGNMSLQESHDLSHRIQQEIMTALPHVTDVLVHLEPQAHAMPS